MADEQGGYFTAQQAREAGYSAQLQAYHAKGSHWQRVSAGIYRLRHYPVPPHPQYVELSLWSRNREGTPQAVIGYETALALHELSDLMPSRIHLIVPPGFRKPPPRGVVLHTGIVPPGDLEHASGFQLTAPLRTLVDLAGSDLSPEHLHRALHEALNRGVIRRSTLERRLSAEKLDQARRRLLVALEAI
ncbi:hypothetical protein BOO71_0003490 [Deinococcus marmoris]|uniref:AbiEi antitoxin C-terminal domain-containing protein n=1 Tax=Deinococcus marmoris TaxID=249408 RepID=A0A1U7P238_9DEIO|nr:hypothetical protein BOO71_0003490 [Deinococcus marmoris]